MIFGDHQRQFLCGVIIGIKNDLQLRIAAEVVGSKVTNGYTIRLVWAFIRPLCGLPDSVVFLIIFYMYLMGREHASSGEIQKTQQSNKEHIEEKESSLRTGK